MEIAFLNIIRISFVILMFVNNNKISFPFIISRGIFKAKKQL